jgi:hypothetical protein
MGKPRLHLSEASGGATEGVARCGLTPAQWVQQERIWASAAETLPAPEAAAGAGAATLAPAPKRRRLAKKSGLMAVPPSTWDERSVEAFLTRASGDAAAVSEPRGPCSDSVTAPDRLAVTNAARLKCLTENRTQLKTALEAELGEAPNKEQLRRAGARGFHALPAAEKVRLLLRLKVEKGGAWPWPRRLQELVAAEGERLKY